MIACKALAGDEQDAKAEQSATQLYLHEKILGIVVAGIAFAIIADKIGSTHLLGCFLAGVVATAWKGFQEIWEPMVEPILPWMTMAFFSCTVGFAVPVSALAAKDRGFGDPFQDHHRRVRWQANRQRIRVASSPGWIS